MGCQSVPFVSDASYGEIALPICYQYAVLTPIVLILAASAV